MEGKNFLDDDIRKIVESRGYEFIGLELKKEHSASFVRIYIDSLGGISVRDCEIVSREINRWLEDREEDLLDDRYYLEVSSPGLERPLLKLEDFRRFSGKEASVRLKEPLDGHRRITGILSVSSDGLIKIEGDDLTLEFPLEMILAAKLKYTFEKNKKAANVGNKRRKKTKKQETLDEEDL